MNVTLTSFDQRRFGKTSRTNSQRARKHRRRCGNLALGRGMEPLEDRRLLAATFEIGNLLTTNSAVIEHNFVTGDDRGGIAVSDSHVFYTGDGGTGAFSAADLSGGTNVGATFDSLTSNLLDGTVYSLGTDATTPFSGNFGSGTITHLLEHDGATGALTGASIELSSPISVDYGTGIFAGAGRVLRPRSWHAASDADRSDCR